MPRTLLALDIGSQHIRAIVAEFSHDRKPIVRRVLRFPSDGVRKGVVDDVSLLTRALGVVFSEIKTTHKDAVKYIYLSIGSPNIHIQASRGIVAVARADLEIYHDDITRAIEASQAVKLAANRLVLHTLTEEFSVDDIADIKDPLGMVGNRLEARSLIIDAFGPAVKNVIRSVETAGGNIAGIIFNPLASARSVLSKQQKELGCCLLDVGFGTTSFAVFQENKLLHTGSFVVGSGHITNDLAIGLKTSIDAAEQVKFVFGSAVAKDIPIRETVEITKFDPSVRSGISRRFLAEIIEVRTAEIFDFVHSELRHVNRAGQLPGGIILTGGGAKLPGLLELAKQEFRLPARIGAPDLSAFTIDDAENVATLDDPQYACALGLLLWGQDRFTRDGAPAWFNVSGWIRRLVDYFLP